MVIRLRPGSRGPGLATAASLLAAAALVVLTVASLRFGSAAFTARSPSTGGTVSLDIAPPGAPERIEARRPDQAPASHPGRPAAARSAAGMGADVVRLTNQQRLAHGCRAVRVDPVLTRLALEHSQDMAEHSYFSHDSRNGRSPFDRMTAAGYRYSVAAENIAAGQRTPADVVRAWMASPGHRANILNCTLAQIGVGFALGGSYGTYWAQDFGTSR